MQDFIAQLNQANPGAQYAQTDANTIVGSWNKDAAASGAISTEQIHFDYQVIVTLNPIDKSYTYTEKMQSSNSATGPGVSDFGPTANSFGLGDNQPQDGGINVFHSSSQSFTGKTFGNKQMGFSHQWGGKPGGNTISYNFDADKIKQPLLIALQATGYHEQKKSFLKKLFG